MNREKKFLAKLCIFLFMMLCATFVFAKGDVKDVQAASQMVKLKEGVTYTKYDFTRDGKKDRFKYVNDRSSGNNYKIYINGKYKKKLSGENGIALYWCRIDRKNTYLLSEKSVSAFHSLTVYMYSGGNFKAVKGTGLLDRNSLRCMRFSKIQGDTLYVSSEQKIARESSFKNASGSIKTVTKFKLRNNKISCLTPVAKITGRRTFYAKTSFQTSANSGKLNVKNGPKVKAGQKVTLNYIKFDGFDYIYQISVGGRKGWFKDSYSIQFR